MKLKINLMLILVLLSANFLVHSQSSAPISFDIRGRDCAGGGGFCSASKTSDINNNITINKTAKNTFVLTLLRTSLTAEEESNIAGGPFSTFNANLPKTFVQNGDLKFSDEVVQSLGLSDKYNLLKKGSYPMVIDDKVVKITLTLSEGKKP